MKGSTRGWPQTSRPIRATQYPTVADVARASCTIPDPCTSDEDARRFYHDDLPELADFALAAELHRVSIRLSFERPATYGYEWLAQRSHRIQVELALRSGRRKEGRTDAPPRIH